MPHNDEIAEDFRHGYINNHECKFSDDFTKLEQLEGYPHRYYIRHGDSGNPATLEPDCPVVNFWGTAFFKKPLRFAKGRDYGTIKSWWWEEEG